MPSINIDVDVDLEDFDADDLVEALLTHSDWRKQLDIALSKKSLTFDFGNDESLIAELIENYRLNKNITPVIENIAYQFFGRVV